MCEHTHWQKCTLLSNHIVLIHGKRGSDADIVTDFEIEKQLEAKVEEAVLEIRDIQMKKSRGEAVGEKKPLPTPKIINRQPTTNYRACWDVEKNANEQKNKAEPDQATNEKPQLASKLSQAVNSQHNSTVTNGQVNPPIPNQSQTNSNVPVGSTSLTS